MSSRSSRCGTIRNVRLAPVAVFALLATSASADPAQDAKAKVAADAGAALFEKDDFAGAVAKFQEAYDANHDPSYLFNIAQAYRHASDCVRAADYYGRFLSEVPHPPNEDKIRGWYASEMQCAKQRAATQPVDNPSKQEPPKHEPPKQEPPKHEPPKQEPPKQEPPTPEPVTARSGH